MQASNPPTEITKNPRRLFECFLLCTWDAFSAPCILAIHYSSLPLDNATGNRAPGIFVAVSAGLAVVVTAIWWWGSTFMAKDLESTPTPLQVTGSVLWQGVTMFYAITKAAADVGVLFIFSQEITRSRDSPMYIPAEYAYVIPTLCLFFLLPPILDLSTPQRDASTAAESNWLPGTISALPYQIVCITGIVSFGIVLGYTPEPYDASRRLSIGEAMVPFLAMATLHLTPAHGRAALTRSRDAPDWLGVLVSGFCFGTKLAILIVGIYLMSLKPSQNISARQHDFHLLRSITQKEEHTLADATLDPREGGAYSDLSPAKITAGIILKTHFLLSGTCWFAHAQRTLLSWISVLQIDRRSHLSDLHDLCIGLAVLVITLGIVTSSRQMQGNQNIHSVGPAWSILGGASLVSAAVLIYLVQLLFGTWIDKEGSRGEWLLLKT